jgi:hypothetical protein
VDGHDLSICEEHNLYHGSCSCDVWGFSVVRYFPHAEQIIRHQWERHVLESQLENFLTE